MRNRYLFASTPSCSQPRCERPRSRSQRCERSQQLAGSSWWWRSQRLPALPLLPASCERRRARSAVRSGWTSIKKEPVLSAGFWTERCSATRRFS